MQSPITYYGGKKMMVDILLQRIPQHRIYVEPFAGGASLFFEKGPSYLEVLNDLNENLYNFYHVAQASFDELKDMINNTLLHEGTFKRAQQIYRNPKKHDNITRAWAVWLSLNFAYNAKFSGGIKFCNGTGGSHIGRYFCHRKTDFLPWIKERLAYVQIQQRPALEVIKFRDTPDTFFYLDPPYVGSDQGHYAGYKIADLILLLDQISTIKGKFMLSHFNHPVIDKYIEKYSWQKESFEMRHQAKSKIARKTEILVMNYKPVPTLFDMII
jgi:DNA adenine methylase